MITQKIKHWLSRLFAWWPWKRPEPINFTHVVGNVNTGMTEQSWRVRPDGPMPQPGSMSVAVEQQKGEPVPEKNRFTADEQNERLRQTPSPGADDKSQVPHNLSAEKARETPPPQRDVPPASPTHEQQLAFLHYLVKRGIVNEGFSEGEVPEQYRPKER